jgi:hypothetical protein
MSMRGGPEMEQLALDLGESRAAPRWRFSRLLERSRHRERVRSRLEFVRRHFQELDGTTIRVGLVVKRGVLGWGSLDRDEPGIWVRPRRLDYFTIAHELTHLLQARGLVPHGERACDLYALARSPLLVDVAPGYLRLPPRLQAEMRLPPAAGWALWRAAREALAAKQAGRRDYLRCFEHALARMDSGTPPEGE